MARAGPSEAYPGYVATSAGAMLALAPLALLAAAVVFLIIIWLSRIVSLGSILAAVAVAVFAWMWPGYEKLLPLKIFVTIMSAAVIVKHRANILRLLSGTENRIGGKTKAQAEPPVPTTETK